MATSDSGPSEPAESLSENEIDALHAVELALEWLQRAQGSLIEFHHATGHGMDHLARAETLLREAGYDDLANEIRDDVLPHGVIDGDRWSYGVLEDFQHGLLPTVTAVERTTRETVADGARHVHERRQERRWKDRAEPD